METKKWWESKIVWLGIIETLIGVLQIVQQQIEVGSLNGAGVVNILIGALTIIMRVWFTNKVIS